MEQTSRWIRQMFQAVAVRYTRVRQVSQRSLLSTQCTTPTRAVCNTPFNLTCNRAHAVCVRNAVFQASRMQHAIQSNMQERLR
jgi:hypothetical protein